MSANTSPVFTLTPKVGSANLGTANTGRDGSGTLGTLLAAGTNGTMIERVTAKAQGTTAAGMIRLFLFDGTTYYLYEELATSAVTPSGTVASAAVASAKITPQTPLVLPSGWSLKASTHNAETWSAVAEAGDF